MSNTPGGTPAPAVGTDGSRSFDVTPTPISSSTGETISDTTPGNSGTVEDVPEYAVASCGESDEFWITTSEAPEVEGCYKQVDFPSSVIQGAYWYSPTGTPDSDQMSVAGAYTDGESVSQFLTKIPGHRMAEFRLYHTHHLGKGSHASYCCVCRPFVNVTLNVVGSPK